MAMKVCCRREERDIEFRILASEDRYKAGGARTIVGFVPFCKKRKTVTKMWLPWGPGGYPFAFASPPTRLARHSTTLLRRMRFPSSP